MNNTPRIGFIGMGLMGVPMSLRLLQAGFPLTVWNRNPDKCAPQLERGAHTAGSIAELVTGCDIVMLCVSDTAAVEAVVFATDGIVSAGSADKLLVDFSSIAPDATRDFAGRLQEACGMRWVDAPVSGGVAGAEAGTLAIMAGGEGEDVERLRPVFAHLSQRVTHMGPVGSGQATKVCNQMLVSCNVLVMAEVLAVAEKAGVDATRIPEALRGGFADSIPLQLTGSRMANGDFTEIKWHVKTLLKDLNLARALAAQTGSETPMAELGARLMQRHGDNGFLDQDPSTLIQMYRAKE